MFYLMSVVEIVRVKIVFVHLKALEMRMRKLVFNLSIAQILPQKINKYFDQKCLDSLMCCQLYLYEQTSCPIPDLEFLNLLFNGSSG